MNADSTLTPDTPSSHTCEQIKALARAAVNDVSNDQLDGDGDREWQETAERDLYDVIYEALRQSEIKSPAAIEEDRAERQFRRDRLRRELTV